MFEFFTFHIFSLMTWNLSDLNNLPTIKNVHIIVNNEVCDVMKSMGTWKKLSITVLKNLLGM